MSLEGGKLTRLGNAEQKYSPQGNSFKFGWFVSCDCVLDDPRSKNVHCEIKADAFGRITIRNFCMENPIKVNGKVVATKRPLLSGTTLEILNSQFLWEYTNPNPKRRQSAHQLEDVEEMKTPKRQMPEPEQPPNSEPNLRKMGSNFLSKRITNHNFIYWNKQNATAASTISKTPKSVYSTPKSDISIIEQDTESPSKDLINLATPSEDKPGAGNLLDFETPMVNVKEGNKPFESAPKSANVLSSQTKTKLKFADESLISAAESPVSELSNDSDLIYLSSDSSSVIEVSENEPSPLVPYTQETPKKSKPSASNVTPRRTPQQNALMRRAILTSARKLALSAGKTNSPNIAPIGSRRMSTGIIVTSRKKVEFDGNSSVRGVKTISGAMGRRDPLRKSIGAPLRGSVTKAKSPKTRLSLSAVKLGVRELSSSTPLANVRTATVKVITASKGKLNPPKPSISALRKSMSVLGRGNSSTPVGARRSIAPSLARTPNKTVTEKIIDSKARSEQPGTLCIGIGEDSIANETFTVDSDEDIDENGDISLKPERPVIEGELTVPSPSIKNILIMNELEVKSLLPSPRRVESKLEPKRELIVTPNNETKNKTKEKLENSSQNTKSTNVKDLMNIRGNEPNSPSMAGVKEFLNTPQNEPKTPRISGVQELLNAPRNEPITPRMAAMKELLTAPVDEPKTPHFRGVKELMNTPRNEPKTPRMAGLKELLHTLQKEPKTPRMAGMKELLTAPVDEPKTPHFGGVKELMKTPRNEPSTPRMAGVKELLHTPQNELKTPGMKELLTTSRNERIVDRSESKSHPSTPQNGTKPSAKELDKPSTPHMSGVNELMNTPKNKSPFFSGIRELLKSPKDAPTTPILKGVREMMTSPKKLENTPKLSGIKEMMKVSNVTTSTPIMKGLKEMMKSPSQYNDCDGLEAIGALLQTPIQSSRDLEDSQTPVLKSIKDLMKTPCLDSPKLRGVRDMTQLSKLSFFPEHDLDVVFKTPSAKDRMVLGTPTSAVINKDVDSVEMVHRVEYDLEDHLQMDEIFPASLKDNMKLDDEQIVDKKEDDILTEDEKFDKLTGKPIIRKKYNANIRSSSHKRKGSIINTEERVRDETLPTTDVEDWLHEVENATLVEGGSTKDPLTTISVSKFDVSNAAEISLTQTLELTSSRDPLAFSTTLKSITRNVSSISYITENSINIGKSPNKGSSDIIHVSNMSGLGLLEDSSESSMFSGKLVVTDDSSETLHDNSEKGNMSVVKKLSIRLDNSSDLFDNETFGETEVKAQEIDVHVSALEGNTNEISNVNSQKENDNSEISKSANLDLTFEKFVENPVQSIANTDRAKTPDCRSSPKRFTRRTMGNKRKPISQNLNIEEEKKLRKMELTLMTDEDVSRMPREEAKENEVNVSAFDENVNEASHFSSEKDGDTSGTIDASKCSNIADTSETYERLEVSISSLSKSANLDLTFENFVENPVQPIANTNRAKTPDCISSPKRFSRRTMGNKPISQNLNIEEEKKLRKMELTLLTDEDVSRMPREEAKENEVNVSAFDENVNEASHFSSEKDGDTSGTIDALKCSNIADTSEIYERLEVSGSSLSKSADLDLTFENFVENPVQPIANTNRAKTPDCRSSPKRFSRRTMGNKPISQNFNIEEEKKLRKMELTLMTDENVSQMPQEEAKENEVNVSAFDENVNEASHFSSEKDGDTSGTIDALKCYNIADTSEIYERLEVSGSSLSKSADLDLTFENFVENPVQPIANTNRAKTPDCRSSPKRFSRRTMGNKPISQNLNIEEEKKLRKMEFTLMTDEDVSQMSMVASPFDEETESAALNFRETELRFCSVHINNITITNKLNTIEVDEITVAADDDSPFANFKDQPEIGKSRQVKTPDEKKNIPGPNSRRTMGHKLRPSEVVFDAQASDDKLRGLLANEINENTTASIISSQKAPDIDEIVESKTLSRNAGILLQGEQHTLEEEEERSNITTKSVIENNTDTFIASCESSTIETVNCKEYLDCQSVNIASDTKSLKAVIKIQHEMSELSDTIEITKRETPSTGPINVLHSGSVDARDELEQKSVTPTRHGETLSDVEDSTCVGKEQTFTSCVTRTDRKRAEIDCLKSTPPKQPKILIESEIGELDITSPIKIGNSKLLTEVEFKTPIGKIAISRTRGLKSNSKGTPSSEINVVTPRTRRRQDLDIEVLETPPVTVRMSTRASSKARETPSATDSITPNIGRSTRATSALRQTPLVDMTTSSSTRRNTGAASAAKKVDAQTGTPSTPIVSRRKIKIDLEDIKSKSSSEESRESQNQDKQTFSDLEATDNEVPRRRGRTKATTLTIDNKGKLDKEAKKIVEESILNEKHFEDTKKTSRRGRKEEKLKDVNKTEKEINEIALVDTEKAPRRMRRNESDKSHDTELEDVVKTNNDKKVKEAENVPENEEETIETLKKVTRRGRRNIESDKSSKKENKCESVKVAETNEGEDEPAEMAKKVTRRARRNNNESENIQIGPEPQAKKDVIEKNKEESEKAMETEETEYDPVEIVKKATRRGMRNNKSDNLQENTNTDKKRKEEKVTETEDKEEETATKVDRRERRINESAKLQKQLYVNEDDLSEEAEIKPESVRKATRRKIKENTDSKNLEMEEEIAQPAVKILRRGRKKLEEQSGEDFKSSTSVIKENEKPATLDASVIKSTRSRDKQENESKNIENMNIIEKQEETTEITVKPTTRIRKKDEVIKNNPEENETKPLKVARKTRRGRILADPVEKQIETTPEKSVDEETIVKFSKKITTKGKKEKDEKKLEDEPKNENVKKVAQGKVIQHDHTEDGEAFEVTSPKLTRITRKAKKPDEEKEIELKKSNRAKRVKAEDKEIEEDLKNNENDSTNTYSRTGTRKQTHEIPVKKSRSEDDIETENEVELNKNVGEETSSKSTRRLRNVAAQKSNEEIEDSKSSRGKRKVVVKAEGGTAEPEQPKRSTRARKH